MVSKTMAASLDRLNRVIRMAEERLARVPQAWSVEYGLDSLGDEWEGYELGFRDVDGEPRLCRILREDARRYDADSGEVRPITDLPVHDRRKFAELIPAFVELCNDQEADYAAEIDVIAHDIVLAVESLN